MRRIPTLALIVLATLALPALATDVALAGDGDGTPRRGARAPASGDVLSKLTPEELAQLKRIPNWAELPPAMKQKIAAGVLRMRGMTPEQRERMERHIKKMRERQKRGGRRDWRGDLTRALVNRGLAREALKALGPAFEQRLVQQDLSSNAFEMAVSMTFIGKVADQISRGEIPAPGALPEEFPARMRERYGVAHAAYAATEDPKERQKHRRKLGFFLALARAEQFRASLARADVRSDGFVAAVGARLREEWPEAFAATVKDPAAMLRQAEKVEVRRGLRRIMQRQGALDREESALLVRLLDRKAGPDADKLIKDVLVDNLGVQAEVAAALPPSSEPEARLKFFQRLLAAHGFRALRGSGGPGRPGRMKKPDGVSAEGWARLLEAMKQAGKSGRRRGALRDKPDGVSDEDWKAFQAWREGMKQRGGPKKGGGPNKRPR